MFQLRDHMQQLGRWDFVQRRLNLSRRKPSLGGSLGGRFDNEQLTGGGKRLVRNDPDGSLSARLSVTEASARPV
jgi:hypothetical protein